MFFKVRSVNRIKIFITSHKTKDLSNVLNSQWGHIIHETLMPTDTSQDIEAYVTRVVRANMPQDEDAQDEVIEQILEKANGSFLWVKLTLDTIRDSWHTQEDVRRTLMQVPRGMEPLYDRMLRSVLSQATRNREMAQEILTWAVCSFRPLRTAELKAALLPKFAGFVSLEDTIGQICGHFIHVSNEQAMLVHATARYFLLNKSDGFIRKHESHEQLAMACIRYLSDDNWKHVFALGPKGIGTIEEVRLSHFADEYPFLGYAVHHWAYHVNNAVSNSDSLLEVLEEFFHGYLLAWIHGVALSANLRTLARTAQYIRSFVHRRAHLRSETDEPPLSLRIQDSQWLRLWAIDLIRIIGKFGRILLQSPGSIRLIPVLCPLQSQIRQIYGRPRDQTMSVSGLSSTTWDDCLARVSGSEDETVSRILATDTYFITLISSSGKAMVWSAETCEELRYISHGEYVTRMALDKLGTTLSTAGMRTIRIWEVSSGQEIYSFPRNSEAKTMTLVFGDVDDSLIIGREDYSVQTYDLNSGRIISTFWAYDNQEAFQNCPRLMVLSPDLSKVAVAERGKPVLIWDLHRPAGQQPWRCVRTEDLTRHFNEQEAWNAPEVVCWHPEGTSIFILYQDSNIVHWSFIEEAQKEYSHVEAREMVISKDGNFLLTSDSSGALGVWSLPRFNLIYKLFYEEFVRDLAFSPDGQRIYDSRGPFCNIWEPDVLIRHEDVGSDDASSNYEYSILSDAVISQDDSSRSQVTALVCDSNDSYYCCGKDDGSVAIHSASDGERIRKVYNHSTTVSITVLAWSGSGKYVVSGDDAGRIICKRLEVKDGGKWAVFPVFDIRIKDSVRQFLLNSDESLFLVSTESTEILWNIRPKTKKEVCREAWNHFTGRRWRSHPLDSSRLIWMDPVSTTVFDWATLERSQAGAPTTAVARVHRYEDYRPPLQTTASGSPDAVRCVSQTRNGRHLVIEIVPDTGSARSLAPRGLKVQRLTTSSVANLSSEKRTSLTELATQATRVLGIFQDRILFLDRMFWVCSWDMSVDTAVRAVKSHFFLPRDWLILLSGYPSSGKTYRSSQLLKFFNDKISTSTNPLHSRLSVVHINDQSLGLSRSEYATARAEKDARAALSSAVKRSLGREVIVIADALNYIKGFRYQLYCEAKALQTPSCVIHVGTPIPKCRSLNDKLLSDGNGGYEPELFENLIFRYEEPNGMTRWDSPLFTVPYDDETPPFDAIWDALIGSDGKVKAVRPNQATVLTPAASSDALYILEKTTSAIISHISTYLSDHAGELGGTTSVPDAKSPVQLPTAPLALPQLQRLRRQFVALYRRQEGRMDAERVGEAFVEFLNGQWGGEEG